MHEQIVKILFFRGTICCIKIIIRSVANRARPYLYT